MREPFRIFIGYDARQPVSYTVLQHSIIKNLRRPASIAPLVIEAMPMGRTGLTPFTFSRFCVPYLSNYQGWALFLDADMMARCDVTDIFDYCDDAHDVIAVDTTPKFERAAVILFNNARCGALTLDEIRVSDGLHKLGWGVSPKWIGTEWNHLVGYDAPRADAKIVHFTQGVPAYPETKDCEYSGEWRANLREAVSSVSWMELMGSSVHAAPVMERIRATALV